MSRAGDADAGAARHTFPRARSLKRRRLIRPLFDRARPDVGRVRVGVVDVRYRLVPAADVGSRVPLQAGFAPGRRARTHVGRNRLRRHMRETFRLHQHLLQDAPRPPEHALVLMVVFRGREASAGPDLRRDLPEALRRLSARLRAEHAPPS